MAPSEENEAKEDFSDIYTRATPHAYLRRMASLGYQIAEQAAPFIRAGCDFLAERNGDDSDIGILDLGCSYGVISALIKYGCGFEEVLAFFDSRAPDDPAECVRATDRWLHAVEPREDVEVVGIDSSAPAIRFANAAGLLDAGIARDFEQDGVAPTPQEAAWIARSNLLVGTGAVGYVTERTFSKILPILGTAHDGPCGPIAILTILRMFETGPVQRCFRDAGMRCEALPSLLLPQRAFANEKERREIIAVLQSRGIATGGLEDEGVLFAELWLAARPAIFDELRARLQSVAEERETEPLFTAHVEVALASHD